MVRIVRLLVAAALVASGVLTYAASWRRWADAPASPVPDAVARPS